MQNLPEKISAEALASFRKHTPDLIRRIVELSMRRTDDIAAHGEAAERLVTAGLGWTFKMLDTAMEIGEAAILEQQLDWAKTRLAYDKVEAAHIHNRLEISIAVITDMLDAPYSAEIIPYLELMLAYQKKLMGNEA